MLKIEELKDVRDMTLNVLKVTLRRTNHVYHEDAGHAWLKVPKSIIRNLGIAEKITPYSYEYLGYVYLEEDQDAITYLKEIFHEGFQTESYKMFHNLYITTVNDGDCSRIRDFPRFRP